MITKNEAIAALANEDIVYNDYDEDLDSATLVWEEAADEDYASELFANFEDTSIAITAIRSTRVISLNHTIEDFVEGVKTAMKDLYLNAM